MSLASGSIDLKSLKVASQEANSYITNISGSGIIVHPETISAGANYVQIDGNGFYIKTPGSASIDVSNDKILANFTANEISFYDGLGNIDTNKLASFTSNGVTIGKVSSGMSRIEIASSGLRVIQNNNGSDEAIAQLGYGEGNASGSISVAPYYDLGVRKRDAEAYDPTKTYSVGDLCKNEGITYVCKTAIVGGEVWDSSHWMFHLGQYSFVEGWHCVASLFASHAEGDNTKALGSRSHTEGDRTTTFGYASHAEGMYSSARESYSHAEGLYGRARGLASHAEGRESEASGEISHAEGYLTNAYGDFSHAQNEGTTATRKSQTVLGRFNDVDTGGTDTTTYGDYCIIVGNGTSKTNPSNALTVDWSGRLTIAGHNSPIGTVIDSYLETATNATSGTWIEICNITLDPGVWLITCGVRWPSNSTEYRRLNISETSADNTINLSVAPVNGTVTQTRMSRVFNLTTQKTYYLNATHNAGTTLSMPAGGAESINFMRATRIA